MTIIILIITKHSSKCITHSVNSCTKHLFFNLQKESPYTVFSDPVAVTASCNSIEATKNSNDNSPKATVSPHSPPPPPKKKHTSKVMGILLILSVFGTKFIEMTFFAHFPSIFRLLHDNSIIIFVLVMRVYLNLIYSTEN